MTPSRSLVGKTVLLTGAEGQLGTALVQRFAAEGAKLWLVDKVRPDFDSSSRSGVEDSVIERVQLDITDEKAVADFFHTKVSATGLDVLVNNAGVGVFSHFNDRTMKEFDDVFAVNVKGVFLMIRSALRYLARCDSGSVINIGSIYGSVSSDPKIYSDTPRMNSEIYSASKAAVIQLSRYFAVHSAEMGVRVNTVSPGGISSTQGPQFTKNYVSKVPMRRMASPSDITGAVVFFASDDSTYITGQNLIVDGGLTAW